jgi:hypothetical protein
LHLSLLNEGVLNQSTIDATDRFGGVLNLN